MIVYATALHVARAYTGLSSRYKENCRKYPLLQPDVCESTPAGNPDCFPADRGGQHHTVPPSQCKPTRARPDSGEVSGLARMRTSDTGRFADARLDTDGTQEHQASTQIQILLPAAAHHHGQQAMQLTILIDRSHTGVTRGHVDLI